MRYRLRTLLIVLAVLPPLLAVGWKVGQTLISAYTPEAELWPGYKRSPGGTILTLPTFVFPPENQDVTTSEALFDPGGPPTIREDWREPRP